MNKLLNKVYIAVACTIVMAFSVQSVNAANDNKKAAKNAPKTALESSYQESDHFKMIVDNLQVLVQQIKNNNHDEPERKRALRSIDNAFKKLPSDEQSRVNKDILIIKEESKAFAIQRKHDKYDSARAEAALQRIIKTVEKSAENNAEKVVIEAQLQIVQAISDTESVKKDATLIINRTYEQLGKGEITPVEAAKVIGKENYRITIAQRQLQQKTEAATKTVIQSDQEKSYLSQWATSIYNVGSSALAPFKAGYGFTQEEKEVARAIIAQLELQLQEENNRYQAALAQADTNEQRVASQQAFEVAAQKIANEIREQKIITGEVMSTNRKLFWGAVTAAGVITAGVYLMSPTAVVPTIPSEVVTPSPLARATQTIKSGLSKYKESTVSSLLEDETILPSETREQIGQELKELLPKGYVESTVRGALEEKPELTPEERTQILQEIQEAKQQYNESTKRALAEEEVLLTPAERAQIGQELKELLPKEYVESTVRGALEEKPELTPEERAQIAEELQSAKQKYVESTKQVLAEKEVVLTPEERVQILEEAQAAKQQYIESTKRVLAGGEEELSEPTATLSLESVARLEEKLKNIPAVAKGIEIFNPKPARKPMLLTPQEREEIKTALQKEEQKARFFDEQGKQMEKKTAEAVAPELREVLKTSPVISVDTPAAVANDYDIQVVASDNYSPAVPEDYDVSAILNDYDVQAVADDYDVPAE